MENHRHDCLIFGNYHFIIITELLLIFVSSIVSHCIDEGSHYPENFIWIQDEHFNVTCKKGKIEVLNCVSDRGTVIPLMTQSFWENDIEYSCMDDEVKGEEGSGEEDNSNCGSRQDYHQNHFVISCITNKFTACVDKNGDTLKEGLFLLENGQLRNCYIYSNGKRARIESKGCFNGTDDDDIMDESLHIKKYAIWREGNYDLRCGDVGIHVYRCHLAKNQKVHAGTAWIEANGTVSVCGEGIYAYSRAVQLHAVRVKESDNSH
ncbi:unnamed protein product [Thelazia callipaeda]|uniref:Ig-like domain-containing protein n=1 Tax=Thelazia callipaeda TaxID=103827 RepID=A0A0N5DB11_THECL|nr:unnamed protein product [Thelazia callipaeda]